MDEKKYKSIVVIWGVIFLVLHTLSLVNVVGLRPFAYTYLYKLVTSFVAVIMIALIIIYLVLSLKKKKAGPIIGIIVGAVYILSFSIINVVIGVCFIVSCAGMLKDISKENKIVEQPKEEKQEENV